jgi:hypothetical protein
MRKRRRKKRRLPSRMGDTDFETRKTVFEEIKRFNRTELEELYKVLRRAGEEVSENRNGMFFDLLSLKDDTVLKIKELIQFCIENRANFEVREKAMSQLIELPS